MISSISRRIFLQLLAAATATKGYSVADASTSKSPALTTLLDLPRSIHFGLTASGTPLDSGSLYRESTERSSELSFDISNNQISASLTRSGDVRRACICCGIEPLPPEKIKGGVYCTKRLLYGGAWMTPLVMDGVEVSKTGIAVSLVENLLPLFSQTIADGYVDTLFFAPVDTQNPGKSPRALLQITLIENNRGAARTLKLNHTDMASIEDAAPVPLHNSSSGAVAEAPSESLNRAISGCFAIDAGGRMRRLEEGSAITLPLEPHGMSSLVIVWTLSETREEESATIARLGAKSVSRWLEDTLDARRLSYGALSIPQDSFATESMVRFSELSRQSALRTADGRFAGGFLGSDVDTTAVNWPRDAYYSMLAMSIFEPSLCADSIPYFLKWGRPSQTTGSGRSRFPGAMPVSQSLSNSVSGLSLAGAYYRSTGDRNFFRSRPGILEDTRRILDDVLESRRGEAMLFPSMYFSDGEARGDYHTGSNVAAWFAFSSMSRLAEEAYRDSKLANEWSTIAQQIRADLDTRCAGEGPGGRRFFEGANADGTFIAGHDGEESETTLMPFYGFCASDDPRLVLHAELAMTMANPLYSPEIDGIWWYNSDWRPATFPCWTTALAGTLDQESLSARLNRIQSLTDLDGSLWWWPYPYGSKDPSRPLRGDVARKCGWGAAVYLCRFVHDVLGVSVNVPSNSIRFAPFSPWNAFSWKGARIGSSHFDLSFERSRNRVSATLVSHNQGDYSATVVLAGETEDHLKILRVSGAKLQKYEEVKVRNKPAIQFELLLTAGRRAQVSADI